MTSSGSPFAVNLMLKVSNNEVSRDPIRIPNILNEHFATVGQILANQLPLSPKCFTDFVRKCKSPVSSFFQPITPVEIRLEILSIPNNKSHGLLILPYSGFKVCK